MHSVQCVVDSCHPQPRESVGQALLEAVPTCSLLLFLALQDSFVFPTPPHLSGYERYDFCLGKYYI